MKRLLASILICFPFLVNAQSYELKVDGEVVVVLKQTPCSNPAINTLIKEIVQDHLQNDWRNGVTKDGVEFCWVEYYENIFPLTEGGPAQPIPKSAFTRSFEV